METVHVAIVPQYGVPDQDVVDHTKLAAIMSFLRNVSSKIAQRGASLVIATGGKVGELPPEATAALPIIERLVVDFWSGTSEVPTFCTEAESATTVANCANSFEIIKSWIPTAKLAWTTVLQIDYYCRPEWIVKIWVIQWLEQRRIFNRTERYLIKVKVVPVSWPGRFGLLSFVYNLLEAFHIVIDRDYRDEMRSANSDYVPWPQLLLNHLPFNLGSHLRTRT